MMRGIWSRVILVNHRFGAYLVQCACLSFGLGYEYVYERTGMVRACILRHGG